MIHCNCGWTAKTAAHNECYDRAGKPQAESWIIPKVAGILKKFMLQEHVEGLRTINQKLTQNVAGELVRVYEQMIQLGCHPNAEDRVALGGAIAQATLFARAIGMEEPEVAKLFADGRWMSQCAESAMEAVGKH
jgi:hypothetical protein